MAMNEGHGNDDDANLVAYHKPNADLPFCQPRYAQRV
jgi:hypothetical protein